MDTPPRERIKHFENVELEKEKEAERSFGQMVECLENGDTGKAREILDRQIDEVKRDIRALENLESRLHEFIQDFEKKELKQLEIERNVAQQEGGLDRNAQEKAEQLIEKGLEETRELKEEIERSEDVEKSLVTRAGALDEISAEFSDEKTREVRELEERLKQIQGEIVSQEEEIQNFQDRLERYAEIFRLE